MALRDVILLGNLRSSLANINDEGILDTEDGIGGFVGIVTEVKSTGFFVSVYHANQTQLGERRTYVIKWS
jgi:hypothetical protein